MVFLADGVPIVPMGEVEWSGKVVERGTFRPYTSFECDEKLVTQISILDFEKLINAKTVEGRIGGNIQTLGEGSREMAGPREAGVWEAGGEQWPKIAVHVTAGR